MVRMLICVILQVLVSINVVFYFRFSFSCRNGGQCQDDNGYVFNFTCRCLAGFVGVRCEVNVDDCLMRFCANGVICLDGINRFFCFCFEGFVGRFCIINLDDCVSRFCQRGVRCRDRVYDFDCFCFSGYGGKICELVLFVSDFIIIVDSFLGFISVVVVFVIGFVFYSVGVGLLRILVKEVVRRQEVGLGEFSLVVVVVFGVFIVVLVLFIVLLILRVWRRGICFFGFCCYLFLYYVLVRQDQECQVSMLLVGFFLSFDLFFEFGKIIVL